MSTTLKPCPFCGDDMSSFVPTTDGCARGPGLLYVTCDCGAMGAGGKTVADAIAAWNRRAALSPPEQPDSFHLAGGAPQSVREQAVAVGHLHSNGDFCAERMPEGVTSWPVSLYASPLPARMLTDDEVFDAATDWFDDGGSGTERAVRLVRDAIDKFCEVNGLALHQAHQKEGA